LDLKFRAQTEHFHGSFVNGSFVKVPAPFAPQNSKMKARLEVIGDSRT